jgi:hypothetical protein
VAHLVPYSIYERDSAWRVKWIYVEARDFAASSFRKNIDRLLRQAWDKNITTETDAAVLFEFAHKWRDFRPTGFIYHVSRCGSTLLCNMLASVPDTIVLAEPLVTLAILGDGFVQRTENPVGIIDALRASLAAFYRPGALNEQYFFCKFFSGNIFQAQLIRRAFPQVREIFLYRDPIEVIVSNTLIQRQEWLWTERITGVPYSQAVELSIVELAARAIGRKMTAMQSQFAKNSTWLMNYNEINAGTAHELLDFFGMAAGEDNLRRMQHTMNYYSKDLTQTATFNDDSSLKQCQASEFIRDLANRFSYSAYNELEKLRAAQRR